MGDQSLDFQHLGKELCYSNLIRDVKQAHEIPICNETSTKSESEQDSKYNLLKNNCQHYAKRLYDALTFDGIQTTNIIDMNTSEKTPLVI